MVKKFKKAGCRLCGEKGFLIRYFPVSGNGKRWIFIHPDCADEAKNGKFGDENKKYNQMYALNESFSVEKGRMRR